MTNSIPSDEVLRENLVTDLLESNRSEARRLLEMINLSESLLRRLPISVLPFCCFSAHWLQISTPSRAQVVEIFAAVGAGDMVKIPSQYGDKTRIDYEGTIAGVLVVIYGAEAPPSCRIELEEVYVPAHNETVRKLVCA